MEKAKSGGKGREADQAENGGERPSELFGPPRFDSSAAVPHVAALTMR